MSFKKFDCSLGGVQSKTITITTLYTTINDFTLPFDKCYKKITWLEWSGRDKHLTSRQCLCCVRFWMTTVVERRWMTSHLNQVYLAWLKMNWIGRGENNSYICCSMYKMITTKWMYAQDGWENMRRLCRWMNYIHVRRNRCLVRGIVAIIC